MDKKEISIHFGALAEPIEKQLEKQGLKTTSEHVKEFNALNHACLTLLLGDCITDSENDKICKKIFNKLKKSVKPID